MKNYKIAVAGTGYVGLSLGVLFAQHHQVVAVDIVQAKVDMINNKKSPIDQLLWQRYAAHAETARLGDNGGHHALHDGEHCQHQFQPIGHRTLGYPCVGV